LDLRIPKDLAREIVELRIVKNLRELTADSSQPIVEERRKNPQKDVAGDPCSVARGRPKNPRTGLRPLRGTKVDEAP